jgi:hypothetical protein
MMVVMRVEVGVVEVAAMMIMQLQSYKKISPLWKYPICTTLHQDCQWLLVENCYPDRNLQLQLRW